MEAGIYMWRRSCCCCYYYYYPPFFFFSRGARSHAHKTPRSSQVLLRKGVIQVAFLFLSAHLPHVTRATGARRAHRLSKALATPASTRAFLLFIYDVDSFFFVVRQLDEETQKIEGASFVHFDFFPASQSSHLPRYSLGCLSTISAF